MITSGDSVGDVLRDWRRRRRYSQLELATEAEVSSRHLSFMESGRSTASREMLLRLAEHLEMPLRERNRLLLAGGYAPVYEQRSLEDGEMAAARAAVAAVLDGHEPFPALAMDRHWNVVQANRALTRLLEGLPPEHLQPPVNVLRLSLGAGGLAQRIANLPEWRHHLLTRLESQCDRSNDRFLLDLYDELANAPPPVSAPASSPGASVAVPLRLRLPQSGEVLSLLSTTTMFSTATDITLSELALECFYPADETTRQALLAVV